MNHPGKRGGGKFNGLSRQSLVPNCSHLELRPHRCVIRRLSHLIRDFREVRKLAFETRFVEQTATLDADRSELRE